MRLPTVSLSVSVIVTTYNWPDALDRVLEALCAQRYENLEIIIADDGSTDDTAQVIQKYQAQSKFPIIHCWQPDAGFRAAMCRNRAAALAKNDYLIFVDGDCVMLPDFVYQHAKLAEKGWLVPGNRVLLNKAFTHKVLEQKLALHTWSKGQWAFAYLNRKCNRYLPFWKLPLGLLRKCAPQKWQGAKTCNLGIWRNDFIAVNGFDEDFIGWGFEDSDLVIRLQRYGIQRKMGKYALPVLHLWHPLADKTKEALNAQRLTQTLNSPIIKASKGVDQYLPEVLE